MNNTTHTTQELHQQAVVDKVQNLITPPKQAARDNAGKAEWDYVFDFPTAMEALCRVMELGAIKYKRDNWKQGGKPDREYISAMGRHISKLKKGETFDAETGCLHVAHAMWNLMALIELNGAGVTHDPKLFAEMLEHWEEVRRRKNSGTQEPSFQREPTSHSTDEGGINA